MVALEVACLEPEVSMVILVGAWAWVRVRVTAGGCLVYED